MLRNYQLAEEYCDGLYEEGRKADRNGAHRLPASLQAKLQGVGGQEAGAPVGSGSDMYLLLIEVAMGLACSFVDMLQVRLTCRQLHEVFSRVLCAKPYCFQHPGSKRPTPSAYTAAHCILVQCWKSSQRQDRQETGTQRADVHRSAGMCLAPDIPGCALDAYQQHGDPWQCQQ